MSEIPPGAEVPPAIVSKDMGPQCKICTHYRDEHLEEEHCAHIMFYFPVPEDMKPYESIGLVLRPRQLCSCKEFIDGPS